MIISNGLKLWLNATVSKSKDWMNLYTHSGDSKYLEPLIQQFNPILFKYLRHQISEQDAADICQKTWLKIIEKRHLYKEQTQFKAWLFNIARNLMIDELRRQKKYLDCDTTEISITTHHDVEDTQVNAFRAALAKISFEQKEALTLQFEGFSLEQIANITQTEIETVKSRLRYAKKHLSKLLPEEHS
ncbi:RNA polymerase sigma factor [Catenovulum sediminis]|uniref:Sigma-70 family RNA polymerase sigma factor n=1 Tax=Catenovulum sediminis TaxID=1740262 RepID=A0ABV1RGD7_9ALTE|nr:sigma-70 family RNA polymerase sigma factor [Catenovulum sediminis]